MCNYTDNNVCINWSKFNLKATHNYNNIQKPKQTKNHNILTGLCPADVMHATLSLYTVPGSKLSRKNSVSGPVYTASKPK